MAPDIKELERRIQRDTRIAIALIYVSMICIILNVALLLASKGMLPL